MATVTPAMINYTTNLGELVELKFHAVISESHQVSAKLTKFPVQSGYDVTNNAIRQNRIVTIAGVITNTVLEGTKNDYRYSTNNSKTMFEALEELVMAKVQCEVITNLGIYNPVVFTKFTTKQAKGSVDSLNFTITGEEVQVAGAINGTAPKLLSFTALATQEAAEVAALLESVGIDVCDCYTISESPLELGSDFVLEGVNDAGLPVQTTYLATALDPTSGGWGYEIHTSDTLMYSPQDSAEAEIGDGGDFLSKTISGFSDVGDCLVNEGEAVAEEAALDLIDTSMGELKKSIYGAVYDTVALTENDYGQTMIHAGIGCFAHGITGASERFPYIPGEGLPDSQTVLDAATEYGTSLYESATSDGVSLSSSLVTRVDCCA